MTTADGTRWADRAASLYDDAYAQRYRSHDEGLADSAAYRRFATWLADVCDRCTPPFDALDLGCGTGRYFCALHGVRALVGIDASAAMLAQARHPLHEDRLAALDIRLVQGDVLEHDFGAERFGLVYSIGVLAEHVPLRSTLIAAVHRWLRPDGRFAFSTVHPRSASVPQTWPRRAGALAARLLPAPLTHGVRERLLAGGLYADEARVRELMAVGFDIESLERVESEAHLHCLCVARKVDA
jgi:SAM-dependent methyltransferase